VWSLIMGYTWMEVTESDKHSSLFGTCIITAVKLFMIQAHAFASEHSAIKLILPFYTSE
jgi:hypothetical protein